MTGTGHADASPATDQLRHEHEVFLRALRLLEGLARGLETGAPVDRASLGWLVDFFRTFVDQCHHAKEERHLFPALERRGLPRHGGPVAVMLHEHEQGRGLIRAMAQADDRKVAAAIRGYTALLRAHIDKENGVLFPMADGMLTAAEQERLAQAFETVEQEVVGPGIHERLLAELDRIEGTSGVASPAAPVVVDVRAMAPRERHPRIFETFEALPSGAALVLVNDHDPKPLYYQFAAERAGAFTWRYLEEGPEVWRVEIGRK